MRVEGQEWRASVRMEDRGEGQEWRAGTGVEGRGRGGRKGQG